jgi:GNAT superfamily N-acetyltransferase
LIRTCCNADSPRMYFIINEAAKAYDGAIPPDCYHQPYMPREELQEEMSRMTFYGWEIDGQLVGIMAAEPAADVTLVRHAYVLAEYQGQGIGGKLLKHIVERTTTQSLLVGTWADATWAIDFYKRHGFAYLADKDRLLKTYWAISARQIETSVVLGRTIRQGNPLQD